MNYLEKFNNTLEEFINVVEELCPNNNDSILKNYSFQIQKNDYLESFLTNCINKGFDISTKNEIIFSENSNIIEYINLYKLWNDESIDDENKENIWKYIHTLYIYAIEYKYKKNLRSLYNELKNTDENVNEELQTFFNIIESMRIIINDENIENISLDELDVGNDTDRENFKMPDIFGGEIGTLAKEIADGIDPNSINLDNPSKLLQNLMSGNIENDDSGIKDLVTNITNKIQSKINSGELDEQALFKEASDMMGKLNSNQESNPLASMFKNMGVDENSTETNPLASMFKDMGVDENSTETNPLSSMFKDIDINKMLAEIQQDSNSNSNPFASILNNIDMDSINNIDMDSINNITSGLNLNNKKIDHNIMNNRLDLQKRRQRLKQKLKEKEDLLQLTCEKYNIDVSDKSNINVTENKEITSVSNIKKKKKKKKKKN